MYLTYYGANSWLLEFNDMRVLVDPWLVGSLVFANQEWLFKGDRLNSIDPLPGNIDMILLSQGLEDHAHRPTLQALPHDIPVIASPNGAKVATEMGYETVIALAPGETHLFRDSLEIRALSGAPIGLQVENGYWIKHVPSRTTLYYEPHGYPPSVLDNLGTVDVAISPVVNLEIPVVGAIIQGKKTALAIAQTLKPRVFLPTASEGNITYEGVLSNVLKKVGSDDVFSASLADAGLATQFINPTPQIPFEVSPIATSS